ncbi:KUP/HAK/KT family potassium transporter [Streptomyces otsuchiensis]|uniref:KUP/HAK/KT family potassium transporter n=1 Tax=Streptomyces otsuchiensis TaxID=2681388 RepID=UPI00102F915B|nr:KUP/HAK/KT family potassium transporter [Streptomyces otsuchiensis]
MSTVRAAGPGAVVGALGVVFGDIGTSPLYAMDAVLKTTPDASRAVVFGATSTVIWLMVSVVAVLYVRLLLRQDNHGDGGLLALLTLLRRDRRTSPRTRRVLTTLAIIGAAAFLGDSLITPGISVLSAVEGLEVAAPGLARFVVPLALSVLIALFLVQRRGTQAIGSWFGPVMIGWFALSAGVGLAAVVRQPEALAVLSPHWAVLYFAEHPHTAFLSLGAAVLAVTGAEALYADMGNFGRRAVTRAWMLVVMPSLLLTYVGQAAILSEGPVTGSAFYALVPTWLALPAVVLATAATVIASQAVISGAFTVVHQAGRLRLLPPAHGTVRGPRVYLPVVNWLLLPGVILLVVGFGSSAALASAYGLAVTITITVTSLLLTVRLAQSRKWAWLAVAVVVLCVVLAVLVANLPKIRTGGWLPVLVTLTLGTVMYAWWTARAKVRAASRALELPIGEVVAQVRARGGELPRPDGTAVFIGHDHQRAPLALRMQLENENSLHRRVVILCCRTRDTPAAGTDSTPVVDGAGTDVGVWVVRVSIGYDDDFRPREILAAAALVDPGLPGVLDASYVLSEARVALEPKGLRSRARWRIYRLLDRFTSHPADLLDVPDATTMIVGRRVHL